MKQQAVNTLTSFLCFPFVVIIWGTNWLAIKDVLQSSPPLFFTGICLLGGAIAIGKRAHAELEATGERSAPPEAVGAQVLTPSERRVAELAAEGLSNREIAQSLFLTVKTVEGHLTHAYRKLDVHSRTELPKALAG